MYRGFLVEANAPVHAALVEGLAAVTVDLHLGTGDSGWQVLQALKNRQPHQRVIVWTATADVFARARCLTLGVDRVFDRANEHAQLMDYCIGQSEAQALSAGVSGRFPPALSTRRRAAGPALLAS